MKTTRSPLILYTFAFPLPFRLRLRPGLRWAVTDRAWRFAEPENAFFTFPLVQATFFARSVPSSRLVPWDTNTAAELLYGTEGPYIDLEALAEDEAYQETAWVSLETCIDRLETEAPSDEDPGQVGDVAALHRALEGLNSILRAYGNATFDTRTREINIRDVGNLMIMGARDTDGLWVPRSPMFFNVEHWASEGDFIPRDGMAHLAGRHFDEQWEHPFLSSRTWVRRAEYARFNQADLVNAVVSLNTAAESLLFDTHRMLLLDTSENRGEPATTEAQEIPLARLVKTVLPALLGGNWNPDQDTPVARFFSNLYQLRNTVVHRAVTPDAGQTLSAFEAFHGLRNFLVERLLVRWQEYPWTLMAMIGENLAGNPLATRTDFVELKQSILAAPFPYWLPQSRRVASYKESQPTNWVSYPD